MFTFIAATIEVHHNWDATAVLLSWAMGFAIGVGVLCSLALAWGIGWLWAHLEEVKRWL